MFDPNAMGMDPHMAALGRFANAPPEEVASQLAQMFAPGPGFDLGLGQNSPSTLPNLESLKPQEAKAGPGFDAILAGLAGAIPAKAPAQAPLQTAAAVAPQGSGSVPAGPGDQIIAQLMQNIMAGQQARPGLANYIK